MIKNLKYVSAFLLLLFILAACGDIQSNISGTNSSVTVDHRSISTSTPTVPMTPAQMLVQPTSTVSTPNNLDSPPVGIVNTQENGALWSPLAPSQTSTQPNPPMTASGKAGILWVQFPAFLGYKPGEGLPEPQGDYVFFYTPKSSTVGKDLRQGARTITIMKGATRITNTSITENLYITSILVVANEHFLVEGYSLPSGAQSGATTHIWWVEPNTITVKQVATGIIYGGGNSGIEVHTSDWLFWNQFQLNAPTFEPLYIQAHPLLVNLKTGEVKKIKLGGDNVTTKALWSDNKLSYTLQNNKNFVFDPLTEQATQSSQP